MPFSSPRSSLVSQAVSLIAMLCMVPYPALKAANGTWNLNADGTWSNSANWTSGVVADGAGSTAFLNLLDLTTANRVITFDASRTLGSLRIGDNNTGDRRSYIINPSATEVLTLDNGLANAQIFQSLTSAGDTVSVPIQLASSLDILNMAGDRTLTLSGAISSGTAGLKTITIQGMSPVNTGSNPASSNLTTGAVTLSGSITNGAGQVRVVVDSHTGSTVTLSGANSFSGGVTLNTGTLLVGSTTALGTGTFTINGGTLGATAGARLTLASGTPVVLNNSFSWVGSQTLDIGAGASVTLNRSITISTVASQLSIYGAINDGGNGYKLTKTGLGTLYLQGNHTYGGGTLVDGGVLVVNAQTSLGGTGRNVRMVNGGTLAMVSNQLNQTFLDRVDTSSIGVIALWSGTNSANALDFSLLPNMRLGVTNGAIGTISGTGTYSGTITPYNDIFKLGGGNGTLTVSSTLTGATRSLEIGVRGALVGNVTLTGGNTFGGSTTVFGPAVLQLNGSTGSLADTSSLVMDGNGTFRYDNTGATGNTAETVGSLQFKSGDATILSARSVDLDTTLTVAAVSRLAGATGNFTVTGTNATAVLNKVVVTTVPGAGFIDSGLYVAGGNFAAYDSTGTGYIRALNYGVDPDTSTATASFAGNTHVNQTAAVSGQATTSIRTLRVSGAFDTSLAGGATVTVSNGGILKTGGNSATISGGSGITTGGATELVIRADLAADTLTINSNILASSTGGLTKSGAGIVVLGGTNNYGGLTTINAGTLRVIGAQALGSGDVIMNGGTLELRADGTLPGLNNGSPESLIFGQNVVIRGDSTISVNTVTTGSLYQNKLIRIGNLSLGGNTLNVSNNNGYGVEVGGTTTLSPGATGNSILNVGTARTSNFTQGLVFTGKVTGASNISIRGSGSGTAQFTNATNDFVGDLRVSAGVLAVSSDGALGNAANQIKLTDSANGVTATFRAIDTFSTSRSFTLGNGNAVTNVIQVVGGKTFSLNSSFLGSGGFTKGDNGIFEIAAANTGWDGDVQIQDGVVRITNSAALGSSIGTTQVLNLESALHISGGATGLTLAENFTLYGSGVSSTGALLGLSGAGTNTLSGTITLNGAVVLGVETGGTLNLTNTTSLIPNLDMIANGQVGSNFGITLAGGGTGFLAAPINTGSSTFTKIGTGSWTLTGASTFSGAAIINQGTLILSGGGSVAAGNPWQISAGATVVLDNTAGHLDNRLGTRGVHFAGNLTIIGDASANTLETISGSNLQTSNTATILTLDADSTRALTFQVNTGSYTRSGNGTALYRGDNLGTTPGAGVATMLASSAPAFLGQTGAAGTVNRGILPWALVDTTVTGLGTAFATYSATNGIMPLNAVAGEQVNYLLATANVAATGAKTTLGSVSINSLNLASGSSITNQPLQILTVDSGGLLAFAGNGGIQGGLLATGGNRDLIVHGLGDLTIGAVIANTTGGLTKTGAGTLTLTASNLYTGPTSINQGTLKLAGGNQTLLPAQVLNVNYGGTFDLNGNNQTVGQFRSLGSSGNETPLNGGTVTSASAAMFTINQTASGNFAGQITGSVSVVVSNGGTLGLLGNNTYTGSTVINGGQTNLNSYGKISATASISVHYGTLRLDNSGLVSDTDRIADSAAITLRGGTINLLGKAGAMSAENIGSVHLAQGASVLTAAAGTNNGNLMPQSATLTLAGLTRDAAAGATVNFGQTYTNTSAERLGILGNTSGSSENIIITGGLPTTNNIIGPWAIMSNYFSRSALEFAGYDNAGGVGALNAVGFAGYDGTTLPATNQPSQNIRLAGNGTVPAGGVTVNTLNMIGNGTTLTPVLTFTNASDVLNLAAGALAFSSDVSADATVVTGTLGAAPNTGRITAGGTSPTGPVDLFLYYQNNTQNALTINSAIIDNPNNGGQPVRLIVNATTFGKVPVVLASNLNNWSGGTIVNGQLVQIGVGTTEGNLPGGGLTINGGTVTQVAGTIAQQSVTLNGPAALNLINTNTLNAITFDNNGGGTSAPNITLASGATLNLAGNVTATSSNVASTAVITGGTLNLNGANRTFTVARISSGGQSMSPDQATLSISSVISGTNSIIKTGDGLLQLGGANTFTGGVDLQEGGLVFTNNAALGTGTLTLGNNTVITADGSARALTNAMVVGGDFTMGVRGPTVPAALTVSGAVSWGGSTRKVTVNSNPSVVQTISGGITGTGGITKEGIGTLALTGNNSATLNWTDAGDVTVNNGTLRIASDTGLGAAPSASTAGNIVLNGGALGTTATTTLNSNRGIALGNAVGSGTGSLEVAASTTLTYNGIITDNGTGADHLLKTGAGTLALGGANTYTGHTTVAAGTLTLATNGSINNSDRITVNTGASFTVTSVSGGYTLKAGQTLEGSGTVNGNVTALSGSVIAPGTTENHNVDKLTFTSVVTLNAGSTLKLEINASTFTSTDNFGGNAPGTGGYNTYVTTNGAGLKEHDLLSAGTLTQNAGGQIQVSISSVVPAEGQIFNLLDWTTAFNASTNLGDTYRNGAADNATDLDLPDISGYGLMWDISNFTTAGVLVVVVPEPNRSILCLLAFAALLSRRKRPGMREV